MIKTYLINIQKQVNDSSNNDEVNQQLMKSKNTHLNELLTELIDKKETKCYFNIKWQIFFIWCEKLENNVWDIWKLCNLFICFIPTDCQNLMKLLKMIDVLTSTVILLFLEIICDRNGQHVFIYMSLTRDKKQELRKLL